MKPDKWCGSCCSVNSIYLCGALYTSVFFGLWFFLPWRGQFFSLLGVRMSLGIFHLTFTVCGCFFLLLIWLWGEMHLDYIHKFHLYIIYCWKACCSDNKYHFECQSSGRIFASSRAITQQLIRLFKCNNRRNH